MKMCSTPLTRVFKVLEFLGKTMIAGAGRSKRLLSNLRFAVHVQVGCHESSLYWDGKRVC